MKGVKPLWLAALFVCAICITQVPPAVAATVVDHRARGDEVVLIQSRLRDLGYYNYKITGQFGQVTQEAVAAFQKVNGLTPDGAVGEETQKVLFSNNAKRTMFNARKPAPTPTPTPTPKPTPKPTEKPKATEKKTSSSNKATAKPSATKKGTTPEPTKKPSSTKESSSKDSKDSDATKKPTATSKPTAKPTEKPIDGSSKYEGDLEDATSSSSSRKSSSSDSSSGSSSDSSSASKGRMASWSEVNKTWARGETVTVKDVWTGITYQMYRMGGSSHADVEPKTKDDNSKFLKTYGGKYSWDRRPVLVKINGEWIAGSTNGQPHGKDTISGNGMTGQVCIHFLNSRTHGHNAVDPDHQRCIRIAAGK